MFCKPAGRWLTIWHDLATLHLYHPGAVVQGERYLGLAALDREGELQDSAGLVPGLIGLVAALS